MKAFKLRLEQALGSGATLALLSVPACGGSASVQASTSAAGTAGTAGQPTTSAGAPGAAGQPALQTAGNGGTGNQPLPPYPVTALGCSGPEQDGGFYGQCCAEALCYTPDDNEQCAAPRNAPEKLGTYFGSGACLCGSEGSEGIEGPFAANPAHKPEQPGTCCYVITSIICEGRPLLVDGAPIVCTLMERGDWLVAELLEPSL